MATSVFLRGLYWLNILTLSKDNSVSQDIYLWAFICFVKMFAMHNVNVCREHKICTFIQDFKNMLVATMFPDYKILNNTPRRKTMYI